MSNFFTEEFLHIHQSKEQISRQENLAGIIVITINKENLSGVLGSNKYSTTLLNCSCKDFKSRNLPCKHMYRLALEIGKYKSTRNKRTTDLIADFSSGYAADWKFALPTCFRNSLDIKLMPRSTGIKDSDGKFMFENEWTQGNFYSFNEGAIFYSDKIAYEICWADALKQLRYSIKVTSAQPSLDSVSIEFSDGQIVNKSAVKYGTITFDLYTPFEDRFGIEVLNTHKCYQNKFVEFLKSGILETTSGKKINYFSD